ncbi:MAG TPA: hypothetical protein VKA79_14380, partial [Aestuariivirgaceae bacterium]|nr:hypothetical protein [Aestuariivirgaceae bacterium]
MHIRVRQLASAMVGLALAATLPANMQGFPAIAIAETHAPAVASDRDPARQANLKIFDEVWSRVRDSFYDPKFKGLNWEAVGKKYRSQAEQPNGKLARIINEMLAELGASHTGYYTPAETAYYDLADI